MTAPRGSKKAAPRIDRLLRSLVGVTDLRLTWGPRDALAGVHILRDADVQEHQLLRNVISGLRAGFGLELDPGQVHLHDGPDTFTPAAAMPVAPAEPQANGSGAAHANGHAPANGKGNGPSHGNGGAGHANGNGAAGAANGNGNGHAHTHAHVGPVRNGVVAKVVSAGASRSAEELDARARGLRAARAPRGRPARIEDAADDRELVSTAQGALQLERVEVERHGHGVRCRVVIARGEQKFSAVAEAQDGPTAEAELAARVALDALRGGGLTSAMVDGVAFITIAETNYVAAAVRLSGNPIPRASTTPLVDSIAWSAAVAVLSAAGSAVSSLAPVPLPVARHETR